MGLVERENHGNQPFRQGVHIWSFTLLNLKLMFVCHNASNTRLILYIGASYLCCGHKYPFLGLFQGNPKGSLATPLLGVPMWANSHGPWSWFRNPCNHYIKLSLAWSTSYPNKKSSSTFGCVSAFRRLSKRNRMEHILCDTRIFTYTHFLAYICAQKLFWISHIHIIIRSSNKHTNNNNICNNTCLGLAPNVKPSPVLVPSP